MFMIFVWLLLAAWNGYAVAFAWNEYADNKAKPDSSRWWLLFYFGLGLWTAVLLVFNGVLEIHRRARCFVRDRDPRYRNNKE